MIVLETPRLLLRRFTEADIPDLREMLTDPEVMRFYPSIYDEPGIRAWLDRIFMRYEKYGVAFYAAVEKASGEIVGQIGLLNHDIPEVQDLEVGYMLKRRFWGRGFASEAARGCRDYAFCELGREKVISIIDPRNEPSIRVARANGMDLWKKMFIAKFGQEECVFAVERGKLRKLERGGPKACLERG